MSALDPFRKTIGTMRVKRAEMRQDLERRFEEFRAASGEDADALRSQMEEIRGEQDAMRAREIQAGLDFDPRQWMPTLDGRVPILLFPLRVQTRYLQPPDPAVLLVRVFPDDISVQAHDPVLTANEEDIGRQLWNEMNAAAGAGAAPGTPSAIWRGMAGRFGLRRAAWIMRATNPDQPQPAQPVTSLLRVPAVWTLPERLLFRFYGEGEHLLAEIAGTTIPDGLEMGLDPTRPDGGFTRQGAELKYPAELQWQVDFDAAVSVGMGLRVPLDQIGGARGRIARVVVLGVRLSTDETSSAALVEQLIDDHRYTDGFSVVPQGTPTNVTRDEDARTEPDPDATLAWLRGPGAYEGDGRKTLYEDECDGLRLAHALGIDPEALRFVDHANQTDAVEAIAMKRALWAGTLGYYAQQMLWPLFDAANGERLALAARFYFTHFVFGRGPLAAIRVGDQPYGILPVSGDMLTARQDRELAWDDGFIDQFGDLLHGKMLVLARAWIDAIPKISRAGSGTGADARLLDVLGLQASAVEFHSERFVGVDYLTEYVDFKGKGPLAIDAYKQLLLARYTQFAGKFPSLLQARPKIFDLSFLGAVWKEIVGNVNNLDRHMAPLLDGDVIDDLPYSETRPIADAYPNYIAQIGALDFAGVRRGLTRTKDGKTVPVTALLYILLRHSYLYEHAFAAMRLYRHFQNRPWSAFREKEIYNALYVPDTTYWDILEANPPPTWPALGLANTPTPALKLLVGRDGLREQFADWKTYFGDVDELARATGRLARLPTARLERLFAEHLDLCGYRLDAWLTGFVYKRLLALRAWRDDQRAGRVHPMRPAPGEVPVQRYDLNHRPLAPYARGLFLGAFGWVESLEPDPVRTVVPDLPGDLKPANGRPVTRDADNFGLIHAPSLNQAATAALLRAASVTEPDTTAFNIDLSSARVRDALWLIDGVRNGQTPAALLGYKFERGLRERDVTLQQYLPLLRETFPMPRPAETDPGPTESIPAKNVVNGLRMIQAQREAKLDAAITPFILNATERATIATIAAGLLDTLDAASDLMLAESVHQAAQGNYDRAGGVVTAAGEFAHVPDAFDVIATPRSGTSITHRLLIAMNDAPAGAAGSPRARLEPALNSWIGSFLGPLSGLVCGVAYVFDVAGAATRARYVVGLDALALEPIDLLFVLADTTSSELAARLVLATRAQFEIDQPGAVVADVEVEVLAPGGAGSQPIGRLLPFLAKLRDLLTSARPATQRDFLPPNVLHGRTQEAVDAIDADELIGRVTDLRAAFDASLAAIEAVDLLDQAAMEAALADAARFGIGEAVPARPANPAALATQTASVKTIMQARAEAADARWTPPAIPKGDVPALMREIAGILLGRAFPLMPRIVFTDDLAPAALPPANPAPERVEDWLALASTVREDAARLQHARVIAAATAQPLSDLSVLQWPADTKTWIAEPNAFGPDAVRDYVAVAIQPAGDLDLAGVVAALVVDEWHELIPNEKETSGITFHYDAPNAEPPQTLLLAVSARRPLVNLNWSWDELVASVDQALVLAKMRAVGPDELRHTELDAVLPATFAAESVTPATIGLTFLVNISEHIAVAQTEIWKKL